MEKKNTGYLVAIIALAFAVVGLSIGFAFTDIPLTITGNVTTKASSWDVHIDKVENAASTGTTNVTTAAVVDTEGTNITYKVTLNAVGDSYAFDAVVKNFGTYNAKLTSIAINPVSNKYLKHKVTYSGTTYESATNSVTGNLLAPEASETIHVEVSYVDPTSEGGELPTDEENATFLVTLTYSPVES